MRQRFSILVLVLTPVLVAACSSGSPEELGGESGRGTYAERYLDYFLGSVGGEDAMELEETLFNEIQNRIVVCMKAEGFDYYPGADIGSVYGTAFSFDNEEEARSHGFGIVASYRELAESPPPNRNDDYLMALDPAARQAYGEAIDGDPEVPDDGCWGTAERDARESLGIASLVAAVDSDFYNEVLADPRMVDAEQEWVACVRATGFDTDAANLLELTAEFHQEFLAIVGPEAAVVGSGQTVLDSPAVAAFEAKEIEAALATLPCNQKRNEILATVQRELLTTYAGSDS